jgi:hypothetical protein
MAGPLGELVIADVFKISNSSALKIAKVDDVVQVLKRIHFTPGYRYF